MQRYGLWFRLLRSFERRETLRLLQQCLWCELGMRVLGVRLSRVRWFVGRQDDGLWQPLHVTVLLE